MVSLVNSDSNATPRRWVPPLSPSSALSRCLALFHTHTSFCRKRSLSLSCSLSLSFPFFFFVCFLSFSTFPFLYLSLLNPPPTPSHQNPRTGVHTAASSLVTGFRPLEEAALSTLRMQAFCCATKRRDPVFGLGIAHQTCANPHNLLGGCWSQLRPPDRPLVSMVPATTEDTSPLGEYL